VLIFTRRRAPHQGVSTRHQTSLIAVLLISNVLVGSCRHEPKAAANGRTLVSASSTRGGASPEVPSAVSGADASGEIPADAGVPSGAAAVPGTASATGNEQAATFACNEQPAQEFLIDAHFNGRPLTTTEALSAWKKSVARSIRYRTEQYGYFSGFGNPEWSAKPLHTQLRNAKFFGLTVRLHERIIPALKCVEEALARECTSSPYQPRALAGIRDHNTYLDGDVTNHAYGIAIDIDPLRNPCCGCIKPWSESVRCRGKKTEFERMDMPACWVPVFERFGFYWLGHDTLRDTMHFEFLGDPAKIVKVAPSDPASGGTPGPGGP